MNEQPTRNMRSPLGLIFSVISLIGLFVPWLGVNFSSCILFFCGQGTNSQINLFGIAGGTDANVQNAASNNGSAPIAAPIHDSLFQLQILSYIVVIVVITILATSSSIYFQSVRDPSLEANNRSNGLAVLSMIASIIGFLIVCIMLNTIIYLIHNATDPSISWSLGVGGFITAASFIAHSFTARR